MVLYAFVTTPVQYWHNHINADLSLSEYSKEKKSSSISETNDKTNEANCKICSHQYSTYQNNTTLIIETPKALNNSVEAFYYWFIPTTPVFYNSNKGPPSIA
jgi:hypothetical protein